MQDVLEHNNTHKAELYPWFHTMDAQLMRRNKHEGI